MVVENNRNNSSLDEALCRVKLGKGIMKGKHEMSINIKIMRKLNN